VVKFNKKKSRPVPRGPAVMTRFAIATLLAGQAMTTAQPAFAADLIERQTPLMGAFAGARLRMPFGGRAHQRLRAGLTIAPTMHVRGSDGTSRTRFGEGLELGIAQNRPLELSIAGTRLDRLGVAPGGTGPGGRRAGVSTLGWIAIGVGATIVVVAGAGFLVLRDIADCGLDDNHNRDCT
jgi:hypothetical protein